MDSIILKSILKVNPEIERERAESISAALASSLKEKGLLSETDLKHVTQEHLQAESLNEFQSLRLLDWWKTGQHLESNIQSNRSAFETNLIVPIPWDFIWQLDRTARKNKGELAQALIKEKRRPLASAELLLVNAMVGAAKDLFPTAKRDIMTHMVCEVASKYPASFSDKVGDTELGYKRFLKHCKDQHDNYEVRPCKRRENKNKEVTIINMPVKAVIGLTKDSWHDVELPPGETEESQEEMRLELIEYAKRKKERDPARIVLCLKSTYHSQRKAVLTQHKEIRDFQNKKKRKRSEDPEPEMTDLVENWPYLFRTIGMVLHFNKLYNINMEECFHLYFTFNASDMFEYLIASTGVEGSQAKVLMEKAIEKENDSTYVKMLGLIILLAKTFKESVNSFILNEEPTSKVEDIQNLQNLPNTPCIVACGRNTFAARKFYVVMDRFCYMSTASFKDAFKAAYAAFFVFHLDFPKKFGLVCEFIQREILNLNSEYGSKRAEANNSAPISVKLVNLQRDYDQYCKEISAAKASLEENQESE